MKNIFTVLLLWSVGQSALAQGPADYYTLRKQQHRQYDRLVVRYGPFLSERWYVSAEGFGRADVSRVSNTFDGLIAANRVLKPGWSAMIGWTYRDKWAMEGGYMRSPIHSSLSIGSTSYSIRNANNRHTLMLRGKWQLLSTSRVWRRSGFWLTGGIGLVPNSSRQTNRQSLEGIAYRKYPMAPDTVQLFSTTRTLSRPSGLAELGLEYNVRLSSQVELGLFARKYWGLGPSIVTNMTYFVNSRHPQQSVISGNGAGSSFGLAVRYTYSRHHKLNDVYQLKGKQPERSRL